MMKKNRVVALVAIAAGMFAGCVDLGVTNENNPDRNQSLKEADALEGLIAGSFRTFYNTFYRNGSSNSISVGMHTLVAPALGDEFTTTSYSDARCNPTAELAIEPRQSINNDPVSCAHDWQELTFEEVYKILSNSNDVLKAVFEDKIVIEIDDVDQTPRAVAYSKFWQGMGLALLGTMFDRAWIVDENTPRDAIDDPRGKIELSTHTQVLAAAVQKLEDAAAYAQSAPSFTVPGAWMLSTMDMNNADLARLARSMAARFMVIGARTPQERAAVNWAKVIQLVDGGVTADYTFNMQSPLGSSNTYLAYAIATSGTRSFADINLIGEADVSGAYQAWVAKPVNQREKFLITTPDRRITGSGGPTAQGTYFIYRATDPFDRAYGSYHGSFYQFRRLTQTNQGNWPTISRTELNLYKAEALARTGQAQAAADLANLRRVAIGRLPALTAAGVPVAADCVPRTAAGVCGTLLDAIRYERQIEQAGTMGTYMWMDRRGWGTLPKGTPLHLPIPGEQLEILNMERYSFGGGLPGSAQ
jgi:hypothetical protein